MRIGRLSIRVYRTKLSPHAGVGIHIDWRAST